MLLLNYLRLVFSLYSLWWRLIIMSKSFKLPLMILVGFWCEYFFFPAKMDFCGCWLGNYESFVLLSMIGYALVVSVNPMLSCVIDKQIREYHSIYRVRNFFLGLVPQQTSYYPVVINVSLDFSGFSVPIAILKLLIFDDRLFSFSKLIIVCLVLL